MTLFPFLVLRTLTAAYDKSGVMFLDDSFQTLVLTPQDLSQYTIPATTTVIAGGSKANSAFLNCHSNIKKLFFEEGSQLRTIQKYTFFNCAFDDTINMSMCINLTEFSEMAFAQCENLKNIIFPPFIENIKSGSFYKCSSLHEVNFPKSLKFIGGYQSSEIMAAFFLCSSLHKVFFEKGVKIEILNDDLFYGGNLSTFQIPARVKSIRGSTLMRNPIQNISVEDGNNFFWTDGMILTNNQKTIIYYCCPLINNSNVIPDTITSLEDSAFRGTMLEELNITKSVKILGDFCFAESNLRSVSIPSTVTKISTNIFCRCYNLTNVNFQANVSLVDTNFFINCTNRVVFKTCLRV